MTEAVAEELKALEEMLPAETVEAAENPAENPAPVMVDNTQAAAEYREILAMLLAPTFDILAPGWNVTPQEQAALADAYAKVLAKYFPDPGGAGPEIGCAIVTLAIFGPRIAYRMPRTVPPPPPVVNEPPPAAPVQQPVQQPAKRPGRKK